MQGSKQNISTYNQLYEEAKAANDTRKALEYGKKLFEINKRRAMEVSDEYTCKNYQDFCTKLQAEMNEMLPNTPTPPYQETVKGLSLPGDNDTPEVIDRFRIYPDAKLSEIKGLDHQINTLVKQVLSFLYSPVRHSHIKTMSFVGAGGTGKSMTASALGSAWIAKEGYVCLKLDESIFSKYQGETVKALLNVMNYAIGRKVIIFMDEGDILASSYGSVQTTASRIGFHNTLLSQISGLQEHCDPETRILFILSSNNPDVMSIGMQSRFSDVTYFPYPDQEARKEILIAQAQRLNMQFDFSFDDIAADMKTQYWVGRDLERLMHNAVELSLEDAAVESLDFYETHGFCKPMESFSARVITRDMIEESWYNIRVNVEEAKALEERYLQWLNR